MLRQVRKADPVTGDSSHQFSRTVMQIPTHVAMEIHINPRWLPELLLWEINQRLDPVNNLSSVSSPSHPKAILWFPVRGVLILRLLRASEFLKCLECVVY